MSNSLEQLRPKGPLPPCCLSPKILRILPAFFHPNSRQPTNEGALTESYYADKLQTKTARKIVKMFSLEMDKFLSFNETFAPFSSLFEIIHSRRPLLLERVRISERNNANPQTTDRPCWIRRGRTWWLGTSGPWHLRVRSRSHPSWRSRSSPSLYISRPASPRSVPAVSNDHTMERLKSNRRIADSQHQWVAKNHHDCMTATTTTTYYAIVIDTSRRRRVRMATGQIRYWTISFPFID